MQKDTSDVTILSVKKVNHEYTVQSSLKAGVKLTGWMVKSLRENRVAASGIPFVEFTGGEVFLHGMTISPRPQAVNVDACEVSAPIKLLLNKREIDKLYGLKQQNGYTIVLRKLYWEKHLVKAEICLCKGKKLHDKREALKENDAKRQLQQINKKTQRDY